MNSASYENRNEDALYLKIKELLTQNSKLGRVTLAEVTGGSERECRTRKDWFLRDGGGSSIRTIQPLPPLSTSPIVEVGLVCNDQHIPFQHNAALRIVHTVATLAKVNWIALDGDVTDCYEIGRFVHFTRQSLIDEMAQTREYLQEVRIQHKDAKIIYIAGNHEHRWSSYLHKNVPAMAGMKLTGLANCLGLEELEIKWIYSGQAESYYQVPGTSLFIGHFDKVAKFSAYTVKNLVEDKHVNIIQAHTHRMGTYYKSTIGQNLVGYENGCLRHKSGTEYVMDPNWQFGFSLVYVWLDGTFKVIPYHIVETPTHLFTVYNDMKIEAGIK